MGIREGGYFEGVFHDPAGSQRIMKMRRRGINSLRPFSGEFSMILLAHNGS